MFTFEYYSFLHVVPTVSGVLCLAVISPYTHGKIVICFLDAILL